jgi:ADP-dependent NAD(P)H-hydrate dehydratase / NAD(P)H-hydrate epimerase
VIPLLTRQAVRALDADAIARLGVAGSVLMENAGRGAFEWLLRRFPNALAQVAILGGVGQNGGDAWVVARHLVLAGHAPRCVLVGERAKLRGDALTNLLALERMGVPIAQAADAGAPELEAALRDATLLVDGLFGTGLDRAISGAYARVIERINASGLPCLALDIPSGVDADSGAVLGVAIDAALTVTFAAHKRGLHQHPGAARAGELVCASIGVPGPERADCALLEPSDIAGWLPLRAADTHKGRAGHVLVVAGAPGRTGAALLAGLGALRAGAGLVTLCPRAGARAALDAKVIELMTADLPAELEAALRALHELLQDKQAFALGPGLGVDEQASALARRFALEAPTPGVLDADALTAFAGRAAELRSAAAPRVLTPHPKEAGRLLGVSAEQVQGDRYAAATRLAADSGCVVVLKGARSLIASPDGSLLVCPLDVPALAVGGTGDVLAGTIAALLPQLPAAQAAAAGVYLHALAGQLAARSDRGLFAREVADALPLALEHCRTAR